MTNRFWGFFNKPILKNLAISGLGSGFAQFCMLVNALLLARILSPEGFGLYTASYAICSVTAFIFNLGLDTWLLRQSSASGRSNSIVGTVLSIKAGFGIVWGILLFTLLPLIQSQTYIRYILAISIADTLSDGFFTSQISFLNSQHRFQASSFFLSFSRGGRLLLAIILVVMGFSNPQEYMLARWAATLISLIGITIYSKPKFIWNVFQSIIPVFKESIPYWFSDFLSAVYLSADVSLLAIISGDRKAVGTYSPASGIINALFILPSAAYFVFLPNYVRLKERLPLQISLFTRKMFLGFTGLGVVLWVVMGAFSKPILLLILGPAYNVAGDLLVRLSPLLFMKSIEFGCVVLLVANGWQKFRLGPQIASAATNVILNIIFIPYYGVWAVTNIYIISEVILFIGYLWYALKWLRLDSRIKVVVRD